jgi:hypothetical protein
LLVEVMLDFWADVVVCVTAANYHISNTQQSFLYQKKAKYFGWMWWTVFVAVIYHISNMQDYFFYTNYYSKLCVSLS